MCLQNRLLMLFVARGFALDEADLIVLDERMEPALKYLPALIRGENDD